MIFIYEYGGIIGKMRVPEAPIAWRSKALGLLTAGVALGSSGLALANAYGQASSELNSDPLAFFADTDPFAPLAQGIFKEQSVSTPTRANTTIRYYALGDSVAAGLGLTSSPSATSTDKLCGRSPEAYPAIVAADLNLTLANLACSGAVAANLSGSQNVDGTNVPAQLKKVFAEGTPELITITVGANDADWSDFLMKCFAGTCNTAADTKSARADLAKLSHDLNTDLQIIQKRGSADWSRTPTTVVTGYYEPISEQCGVTSGNMAWLNHETAVLNATLEKVTQHFSFVRFAPVEDRFVGHGACTAKPWVQPLLGSAPVHPTAKGQQVIAEAVLRALPEK